MKPLVLFDNSVLDKGANEEPSHTSIDAYLSVDIEGSLCVVGYICTEKDADQLWVPI